MVTIIKIINKSQLNNYNKKKIINIYDYICYIYLLALCYIWLDNVFVILLTVFSI